MTKLQWEKALLRTPDPAREQQTNDILPPDEIVIRIDDLSPREKRILEQAETKRAGFRAALKAAENKRRRKRRAVASPRKKILSEDAEREARLRAESEARKLEREKSSKSDGHSWVTHVYGSLQGRG